MVKHMLRTNFLTATKKKVLNLSRVPVYFSLSEDSFTKMSCQGLFCSVQLSWAEFNCKLVHFHSNWGMETVAKCDVIFCEESPVSVLYALSLWPAVVPSLSERYGKAGGLPQCSLPTPLHMEIQVNRSIQSSRGSGRPTSFPASLAEFYRSLVPFFFCHWREPRCPLLCWLAGSDGHHNSLCKPLCGGQYDQAFEKNMTVSTWWWCCSVEKIWVNFLPYNTNRTNVEHSCGVTTF